MVREILIRQRLHHAVARSKQLFSQQFGTKAKFDVDYNSIIKHIGFPNGDIKDFEIDHIIPLSYHLNGNPDILKDAWHPLNLRWLEKHQNRTKRNKIDTETEIYIFRKMREQK